MTQGDKARLFTRMVAGKLFPFIWEKGYEVTFGEAWRPQEVADLYAKYHKGIANSLHSARLALDVALYKNGIYLMKDDDYKEVGEYWESLSTEEFKCCWGGRFGDGNHFSISHLNLK
jgi:hypothetical protein